MFDLSLYNDEFFHWHLVHAREYSIKTMDWYIENFQPRSVIDFGCGIGSYLESAQNHGLAVLGFDISPHAKKYTPESLHKHISYWDCTWPMPHVKMVAADCVISFETAEHIDPAGTDQFILNLVNATGKRLLFTAAPPGQDGCGHINLQPKSYWLELIGKHLTYNEEVTKRISHEWWERGAPYYIVNNLIVFER